MGNCCNHQDQIKLNQIPDLGISVEVMAQEDNFSNYKKSFADNDIGELKITEEEVLAAIIRYKKQRQEETQTRASRGSRNSLFSSKKLSELSQSVLYKSKENSIFRDSKKY